MKFHCTLAHLRTAHIINRLELVPKCLLQLVTIMLKVGNIWPNLVMGTSDITNELDDFGRADYKTIHIVEILLAAESIDIYHTVLFAF